VRISSNPFTGRSLVCTSPGSTIEADSWPSFAAPFASPPPGHGPDVLQAYPASAIAELHPDAIPTPAAVELAGGHRFHLVTTRPTGAGFPGLLERVVATYPCRPSPSSSTTCHRCRAVSR